MRTETVEIAGAATEVIRISPADVAEFQQRRAKSGAGVLMPHRIVIDFGKNSFLLRGRSIVPESLDTGFWQGNYNDRLPDLGHLLARPGVPLEDFWPKSAGLVRMFAKAEKNATCDVICSRVDVVNESVAANAADPEHARVLSLWVPRLEAAILKPGDRHYDSGLLDSDGMVGYWKRKSTKKNHRALEAALLLAMQLVESGDMPDGAHFSCPDVVDWEDKWKRNYQSQVHPGFKHVKGRMVFDDAAVGGPTKHELIQAANRKYKPARHSWSRAQQT